MEMRGKQTTITYALFFLSWFFFSKDFLQWEIGFLKDSLPYFALSTEQKNKANDGQLYDIGQSLRERIPENAFVVIKNISRGVQRYTTEWMKAEYDIGRLGYYYLCPRKIFVTDSSYSQASAYRITYQLDSKGNSVMLYFPGEKEKNAP